MANDRVAVVVDQNIVDRRSIVAILRKEFNVTNVHQSGTARDALAVIRAEPRIDWIFSDTDLPDSNGFEFLLKARDFPSMAAAAVVMTSARRDKESLLMAATAGVNDYVVKPFTSSILISKLRKIANGHERREAKRFKVFEGHELVVTFGDANYAGALLDISIGGCMVKTELLKQGGGCIYDVAKLNLKVGEDVLTLEGKLLRTESNQADDPGETTMKVAFRFQNVDPETLSRVSRLIAAQK